MELTYRNMATSLAVASPMLVLCILLGAAGIFFLLPRASAGYLGAYAPGGEITSGFSDTRRTGTHRRDPAVRLGGHAHPD